MALVFKVKFQNTLRRWVATESVNSGRCPITFGQLEAKIKELFQISPSASLAITYTDSDDDVVTLANDQDLIDACIVQRLNPLRLDVKVLGGGMSTPSANAQVLPRTLDPPISSKNANIEPFLNALFPQATADAVKGFMRTYTPFIDPMLPAAACLGKAENAFKEFMNGFRDHHPRHPKVMEKHHHHHHHRHHHPRKNLHPALLNRQHEDTTFHWGIGCDGCGVSPIEGIRYKSTKDSNYDLCSNCFKTAGNEADFEKLVQPVYHHPHSHHRPPFLKRGPRPIPAPPGFRATFSRGPYGWKPNPSFPHASGSSASDEHKKLDARFVKDVTIFDGTEVSPGTKFTKIWRMSNIGTIPWPRSTQLVHIGGDVLCAEETVALELSEAGLPCGEEVEVSVDLMAPEKPGRYVSHWRLAAPFGQKFGHRVWAVIHVVPQGEHSPQLQASLQNEKFDVEASREAMDVELDAANVVTMDVDVNGVNKVVLDVMFVGEPPVTEPFSTETSRCSSPHSLVTYPDPSSHGVNEVGSSMAKPAEVGVHNLVVYPDPTSRDLEDIGMSTEKAPEDDGVHNLVVYPDATSRDLEDVGMSTEKAPEDDGAHDKHEVESAPTVVYPNPTSHNLEDVGMSIEKSPEEGGANKKSEVDGFSLVEKPSDSADWFEVGESESFFTPERQKEEEDGAEQEESLVQALEAMGFTDRPANISVLQRHNYVLQDAVDDLLVAAGWEGALKDLGEMGFIEKATNVRLLVKNKGSLKQTVRDLVKLEKQAMEG